MPARLTHARYELRRVIQTRHAFTNWPVLLRQMVGAKIGHGSAEVEFVTRAGVRLCCPNVPGARLPVYEQYADDCYRLAEFLGPLLHAPIRVLDVGAHIGAFALNVATQCPQARVACYEPSEKSADYLRRNIERNGLAERVTVHQAAISDRHGTALFDDNGSGSVHNGLMRDAERLVAGADALDRRRAVAVRTTTFDAAIAGDPPDVVKMDCEGGEYALVYGSAKSSWSTVSRVVMEYHPVPGESWAELRDWLAGVGLEIVRHEPKAPGLGTAWLARSKQDRG